MRRPAAVRGRGSALPRRGPPAAALRTVIRGIGQTLITLGVVVLLFVVYEVYITDLFGAPEAGRRDQCSWMRSGPSTPRRPPGDRGRHRGRDRPGDRRGRRVEAGRRPGQPQEELRHRRSATGFAKIYVPAFGADYVFTIVEGTDPDDLYVGPGHYTDTQYPGQQGNFSVAGHRVSKGSPFNDLGLLASCDALVIETQDDWFVYRVLPMADEVATWSSHPARSLRRASSRRPASTPRSPAGPSSIRVRLRRGAAGAWSGEHGRAQERRAADHPDHLPPAVLRRRADDHPRRPGEVATPRRPVSCRRS